MYIMKATFEAFIDTLVELALHCTYVLCVCFDPDANDLLTPHGYCTGF